MSISIRSRDSNSLPPDYKSPPLTTRTGLPPIVAQIVFEQNQLPLVWRDSIGLLLSRGKAKSDLRLKADILSSLLPAKESEHSYLKERTLRPKNVLNFAQFECLFLLSSYFSLITQNGAWWLLEETRFPNLRVQPWGWGALLLPHDDILGDRERLQRRDSRGSDLQREIGPEMDLRPTLRSRRASRTLLEINVSGQRRRRGRGGLEVRLVSGIGNGRKICEVMKRPSL